MAKKHHMTKHEYNANNRKHQYRPSARIEEESVPKSTYGTYKKKSDMDMKKRLRTIRAYSDDMPDFDEEDDDAA
jgi:hypothetical protein